MKMRISIILCIVSVVVFGGLSVANKANEGEGICITVSPNTLVLSRETGSVSVHTNLPIDEVDCDSLLLAGVAPYLVKADSYGDVVAKFDSNLIKGVVEPGRATLIFEGLLADNKPFEATDTITVKP